MLRPINAEPSIVKRGPEAPFQREERADTSMSNHEAGARSQERAEAHTTALPQVKIRMEYKGMERTTEIRLTPDMIEHLILEAEIRDLRIGELIRDIIMSTVKNNLFRELHDA